jgi:hypothetical protein
MLDAIARNIQGDKLRRLYRFWQIQERGNAAPPARGFDVEGLSPWAREVVLIEVRERTRYRYGYYGTNFRAAFGVDMTGAHVDELPGEQAGILAAEYGHIRRTRRPYWRMYAAWFGDHSETWERLALPLLAPGGEVAFIIAAAYRSETELKVA